MNDRPCEFCKFWNEDKQIGSNPPLQPGRIGECRINPPATHLIMVPVRTLQGDAMNAQVITAFPRTEFNKFCGKFEPKLNG